MSNGSEHIPEHISEICKAMVKAARVWADEVERVEAERDALQDRLDAIQKYVRRVPFPKPDKILAILDPVEVKEEDASRLGVPAATTSETGFDLEFGEDGQ